jgi:hypothetical protein
VGDWSDAPPGHWDDRVREKCGPWKEVGPRLVLRGPCPVCEHDGIDEWLPLHPVAIGAGGRNLAVAEAAEPGSDPPPTPRKHEEFIWCQCPEDHPGRPEDEKRGCGARGRVEVQT